LQAFACAVALIGLALHALRRQRDDPGVALLRLREAQLADAQRAASIGRKETEKRQRETEEHFRTLIEHVQDHAIFMLDVEGRVISWNRGAERILGYREAEILGRHFSCFYPPETGAAEATGPQLPATAARPLDSEGWRVRKDGTRFWAQSTITAQVDGASRVRGHVKVTRDISERKRAEEDVRSYASRLMSTSRRLLEVQESERRRLAGELHDRVGPNLTALGIRLELLESGLNQESRTMAAGLIEDCKSLLQETVAATRSVMGELRPQVLVDYGLVAALRAMASGFARRTAIHSTVQEAGTAGRLPHTVELAMFRIAQEALNNVGKHSRAKRVEIRYETQAGVAALDIYDDGIGFERGRLEQSATGTGWGLIIMRERAEAAGAHFTLETNPGRGVRLRVSYRI
ncbi:MAG: PAS domain-containing sensor histidine kinase, partial [Burkholderiales bacterium]